MVDIDKSPTAVNKNTKTEQLKEQLRKMQQQIDELKTRVRNVENEIIERKKENKELKLMLKI